ncbi:MAG: signal peptide peptidase SppA [Deltaproteobacteria bacterium]|nr:signal peptide peptidase SppA [Deltaproteobacteria bacterium]
MRRHPIIYGLLLVLVIGVVFFVVTYFVASLTGEKQVISSDEKVGVVIIKGVIDESKEINEQLEQYDQDDDIKAIVIRIDSPGGSVVPAQEIYDKVLEVKKNKKVVVSMGSLAASGGYYIASAADKIVANPGTITGSIGVIAQFPQVRELLDKIGIKSTVIKSGKFKDAGSPTREMTSDEKRLIQGVVDDIYSQFVGVVSLNRNKPEAEIEAIADGRIFTGRQALRWGWSTIWGIWNTPYIWPRCYRGSTVSRRWCIPRKKDRGLSDICFRKRCRRFSKNLRLSSRPSSTSTGRTDALPHLKQ